jgi:SAM-dependent methyltransferase
MAPVTFDGDRDNRSALDDFYRTLRNAPWRQDKHAFLADPLNARRVALLLEHLDKIAPATLLDAGCGGGVLLDLFSHQNPGALCLGVDLNPPPAAPVARVRFVTADARALPIKSGAVECAVCSETLEHLPDPEHALAELHRILTPGGHLLVTAPNLFCLDSIEGRLGLIETMGRALHSARITSRWRNGINTHIQKLPPGAWRGLLEQQGFTIACGQPIYIFPYIPYFIAPAKNLEKKLLGNPAVARAHRALDRALRGLPLGQLHFFLCRKP